MSLTLVVGKRHALAGLFLLVLGALLGVALVAPATSQAVTTYTRSASCAGLDFYPTDSRTEYDNYGSLRVRRGGDQGQIFGTGVFRCDPGLPTGAVVKKVQFTAALFEGSGVTNCALVRSGLTAAMAVTAQVLGSVSFAGGTTNGLVRLSDSSIDNATIDNANWGYWLECQLDFPWAWDDAPGSGLHGSDVIYTISSAKG